MELVSVRRLSPSELTQLESLWSDLYRMQRELGMLSTLPGNAFELWWKSLEPTLGRFSWLFLARDGSQIAGFIAARARSLPSYFGGGSVGFISDVYIASNYRGHGTGRSLMKLAMKELQAGGLTRLELQVIDGNPSAKELYASLGWKSELSQMVYLNEKGAGDPSAPGPKLKSP